MPVLQQLNPRGFVIVEARLSIPLSKLLADIKKNIGRGSVLQVFSASSIISREHLLCAYINACMSFEEKTNIASTVGLEMLLFAAMSRQIEESLRRVGAVDGERIVVFADSPKVLNSVKGCLKGAKRFSPSRKASLIAAKRLGLREIDSKSVISAVALSRVCS